MDLSAATFIVRLARSGTGSWTGVVERVRTGEKQRIGDIEAVGRLIAQMASAENGQETMKNCQERANARPMPPGSAYHSKG